MLPAEAPAAAAASTPPAHSGRGQQERSQLRQCGSAVQQASTGTLAPMFVLHLEQQLRTLRVCSACVSAFSCSACSSMAAFRPASAWTSRASPAGAFSCCNASRVAYSAEQHSEKQQYKVKRA